VLQAARRGGLRIPTLCITTNLCTDSLQPNGVNKVTAPSNCRLCLVEVEDSGALSRRLARWRSTGDDHSHDVSRHPSCAPRRSRAHDVRALRDCAALPPQRTCELQQLCAEYGVDTDATADRTCPLFAFGGLGQHHRAGHEQVRPVPPLHPHLRLVPRRRRPHFGRARRPQRHYHLHGPRDDGCLVQSICGQCVNRCRRAP